MFAQPAKQKISCRMSTAGVFGHHFLKERISLNVKKFVMFILKYYNRHLYDTLEITGFTGMCAAEQKRDGNYGG